MEILKTLQKMREFEQNHKQTKKEDPKLKSGLSDKQKYIRGLIKRW